LVRDVIAAVLLLGALAFRWDAYSTGVDSAAVVLAAVTAVAALPLPYLAMTGALPRTWTAAATRWTRLGFSAPFLTMSIVVVLRDVIDQRGVGMSAALGLAGITLVAQPRSVEIGAEPTGSRVANAWRLASVGLAASVPVLTLLSVGLLRARVGHPLGGQEIGYVLPACWLPTVLGWHAVQVLLRNDAARLASGMVGGAALVAVLVHSGDLADTLTSMAMPTAGLLTAFAAFVAITSPAVGFTMLPTPTERPPWLVAAGYGLLAIAIADGILLVAAAVRLGAEPGGRRGSQVTFLVLCLIGLGAAVICRSLLFSAPYRARAAIPALLGGVAFVWVIAFAVVHDMERFANPTASAAAFILPIGVVLAMGVPQSVRIYLASSSPLPAYGNQMPPTAAYMR
jgi:hypothetical protein